MVLRKKVMISAAHQLKNYEGKCKFLHWHDYNVVIRCKGDKLDERGLLIDFNTVKQIVSKFDHSFLNEQDEFQTLNTTAENIAYILYHKIPFCYEVEVEETPGSKIIYREGNQ